MKRAILISVALLFGCSKAATIAVPAEFCKTTYTGKKREYETTTMQFFSYDSKGMCSVQMPVTNYYEDKEVLYECRFTQWQ